LETQGGGERPVVGRLPLRRAEQGHGHLVGARLEVRPQRLGDPVRRTGGDEAVDEAVGAGRREVGVVEAEPPQLVQLVRQVQVVLEPLPGDGAGRGPVPLHDDPLRDGEERLRAEDGAGPGGVLGGDEEGQQPVGPPCGELGQPGRVRAEHPPGLRLGAEPGEIRVDLVEVAGHERQRADAALAYRTAHAEPEHVPAGERLAESGLRGGGVLRHPFQGSGHAVADRDAVGRGEREVRGGERLPAEHLGQPEHAEAGLFHPADVVAGLVRGELVEVAGGDREAGLDAAQTAAVRCHDDAPPTCTGG
jgi:hypothetical protein